MKHEVANQLRFHRSGQGGDTVTPLGNGPGLRLPDRTDGKTITAIHDLSGAPFSSFHRAANLRDLLQQETGRPYKVTEQGELFVVERSNLGADPGAKPAPREDADTRTPTRVLHPAARSYWPSWVLISLCALVFVACRTPGTWAPWLDSAGLPISAAMVGHYVALAAAGVGIITLLRIYIAVYTVRYRVLADAVEISEGFIARRQRHIQLRHVRSVGLRNGFAERLLGVGTLEFASAGTSEVDIRFAGISRPARLRTDIQTRINQQTR